MKGMLIFFFGEAADFNQATIPKVMGCGGDLINRYGFYGDVMKESEDLRWMGPARYDMAGLKVFMQHK